MSQGESLAKLCVLACVASSMNLLGCQDSLGPSIGSVLAREGMMLAEMMGALIQAVRPGLRATPAVSSRGNGSG